MTRIKAGDIVYLPFEENPERVFEVGKGKYRSKDDNSVYYQVYPICKLPNSDNDFTYSKDPVWVEKKEIGEHYSIRNASDFTHAWVSLGFDVCIKDSEITFHKLFEYEPIMDDAESCVESLSSLSDSDEYDDIRSVDSYSTAPSDESDCSFVTNTEEHDTVCENTECAFCKDMKNTKHWFDHEWYPDQESDEFKIKSVIQNVENKYT